MSGESLEMGGREDGTVAVGFVVQYDKNVVFKMLRRLIW